MLGAALAVLLTTSCSASPPATGAVGITVDSYGQHIALVVLCAGTVDGLRLDPLGGSTTESPRFWRFPRPVEGFGSIGLGSRPPFEQRLESQGLYLLRTVGDAAIIPLRFRAAELALTGEDIVLFAGSAERVTTGSVLEFQRETCGAPR